jgi:PAP2 superfamily
MAVFPKECPREQCDVDPPHQAAPDARPRNSARLCRRSPWKEGLRLSVYTGVSGSTERRKTRPLPRAGRKPALMSREAAVRWLLLLLVGLVDRVWMGWAGFHIGPGVVQSVGFIFLLIFISIFYFYTARDERIMHFAHFGAQYLALFAVLTVLSYLAVSTNAPLVDPEFDAIDKALGLDWLVWTEWVVGHPVLRKGLLLAYASLPLQALFGYIYNVHCRANWRNIEIWWITFVSALATISISAFVPAISAWVYYGLSSMADFPHMQQFEATRDGTMRVIAFTDAQGLVQLPSFHTILAIMFTYNLRHNRWFFSAAVILNVALVMSCPTEGGHYFVDLAAGAVVAAATIWGVRGVGGRLGRCFRPIEQQ